MPKIWSRWKYCNRCTICGECRERERENQTTPLLIANSATDVPTVVKTIHPLPEHAQSGNPKIYSKSPKTTQNQILKKKEKNDQELISKLFQLEPQDWLNSYKK